jgi:hypothetical protein
MFTHDPHCSISAGAVRVVAGLRVRLQNGQRYSKYDPGPNSGGARARAEDSGGNRSQ